ncbi:MAG: transporter, partial [Ilumatobacteraceae bacterium]|nr:transporter [Ilumatobacteraceae bacterium]
TVLLSSHLLEEVERICDAAIILNGGIVAAAGSLDALRGEGQGVAVEFDGDQPLVDATLTTVYNTGATIRAEGRGFVISGDDQLFTTVRDAIAASGIGIRKLGRRTVSLEEVFLGVGAANDPSQDPRLLGQLAHLPPPPAPSLPSPPTQGAF